jgi:two-component system LytT family response regulator
MESIVALIVDDEVHNRNVLKTLLKKHCPKISVIAESNCVDDAFEKIEKLKPNLVFLDIKMPNKSGFDLLRLFDKIYFDVIFVSAFNEFAITAFDFNALDYILKPIDYTRLIYAVDRAIAKIDANNIGSNVVHFIKTLEEKNDLVSKISIHHKDKVVLINIIDVVTIESKVDICEIKVIDQMNFYSSKNLKLFESLFESTEHFIRINKSVIINVRFIKSYSKGDLCVVEMCNGIAHEVSRRKKAEVLNKIKLSQFGKLC